MFSLLLKLRLAQRQFFQEAVSRVFLEYLNTSFNSLTLMFTLNVIRTVMIQIILQKPGYFHLSCSTQVKFFFVVIISTKQDIGCNSVEQCVHIHHLYQSSATISVLIAQQEKPSIE